MLNRYGSLLIKISLAACAVILVFLVYSSSLTGPFLFDDGNNIRDNSNIRMTRITRQELLRAGFRSPLPNRPVANISFALNYYLGGYDAAGFRLANILIHCFTGIFLYLFIRDTLRLPVVRKRYGSHHTWLPFAVVVVWLVHPLHTQSVTYIVQRMNSMAAMFYMLSMWLYAGGRTCRGNLKRSFMLIGCIISGLLAFGTKETAATLPFFIYLYEWYFIQDLDPGWFKRSIIFWAAMLILLVGISYVYLGGQPLAKIPASYQNRDFTLYQRVLTEFRVVMLYLSLLVYPNPERLNLDYDFPLSYSLVDPPTTLLSLAAIVGALCLSIFLARKDRLPSFCILWILGNLAIESTVIGLDIVYEHRTYLPSMFFVLPVIVLANQHTASKSLKIAAACSIVIIFGAWTFERNSVWRSAVTLWRDTVAKSPQKARPHNNLANALRRRGEIAEAVDHFEKALEIDPEYAKAYNNLGTALIARGEVDSALAQFKRALVLDPGLAEAHNNIGVTMAGQNRFDTAVKHFARALNLRPDHADAHNNMGAALIRLNRFQEALDHFYIALRLNPGDKKTLHNIEICRQLNQKRTQNLQPLPTPPVSVPEFDN